MKDVIKGIILLSLVVLSIKYFFQILAVLAIILGGTILYIYLKYRSALKNQVFVTEKETNYMEEDIIDADYKEVE